MKASELHMCNGCNGTLLSPGIGTFYKVRVSLCLPKPNAVRLAIAAQMMFPGAVAVARAFTGDEDVVIVVGDESPALWTDLLLCFECYTENRSLSTLCEMAARKLEDEATGKEST